MLKVALIQKHLLQALSKSSWHFHRIKFKMPKYVLHYFDATGRAEPIRLMFHHAGVEFEDHRFKRDGWLEFKKNEKLVPFGKVPTLEVDGELITQTLAISFYLANEFGLNGKNNMETAKIAMLILEMNDIIEKMVAHFMEPDEEKKAERKKDIYENIVPKFLQVLEDKFIAKEGFFLGDSVSAADLHFRALADTFHIVQPSMLDKFPNAKALHERIGNSPNIKKYLESRK